MPTLEIDIFYKELGNRIRNERIKKKISQDILSTQLNLTRASVLNLEKGRHRPSLYQILTIAEILQIDYTALIPQDSEKRKKSKTEVLSNIENAVSDQESLTKSTKSTVLSFLTSIKKH